MFVELLEKLRCPNPHEPTALIATVSRTVDRHIVEGLLGCPVCRAEFPIHEGALEIGDAGDAPPAGEGARRSSTVPPDAASAEEAVSNTSTIRTGALLGLDERAGVYVVSQTCAAMIPDLTALAPHALFIALSSGPRVPGAAAVIRLRGDVLPLAASCARGVVIDHATPAMLQSAAEALVPGGRLVAPAWATVPDGITVLARDDEQWVGERVAAPALSALRRAPR